MKRDATRIPARTAYLRILEHELKRPELKLAIADAWITEAIYDNHAISFRITWDAYRHYTDNEQEIAELRRELEKAGET